LAKRGCIGNIRTAQKRIIFGVMKIRTKQLSALAMLPIVFILISFTTVQKTEPQASGKPVINISQASVFTVRDHSENAPLNPVRYPDFIVTNWQLAKLQLATSMHKKEARQVPITSINIFYSVVTINAP